MLTATSCTTGGTFYELNAYGWADNDTSERINVYLTVLYNLCGRYVTTGELTKLDSIVEQLNGIPEKFGSKVTKEDEKWRTAIMQNLFMYRCIITGEFEKGINNIKNQEDEWKKNQVKISTEYLLVFYSNMYILYFGISDFKKALLWNNKILNREEPVRTDSYINAMIRNIIIHYELGHFDRIDPLAKTTLHFLNKERMPYLFQRFFIQCIQNMSNVNYENKEEYKNTISTFKKRLIVLKNQTPELMELDYKLYMAWLDTHIERKKIAETYKKYLKLR
ncbi:MAG: hypothetical protein HYU69_09805 [Bacteroidetes bacterium]|nr:hypothetical protein [Bacteroidota bacterium]